MLNEAEDVARRALEKDAMVELLLGTPGYAYLPKHSSASGSTDLALLLTALCREDLGYSRAEVRARLEKAIDTIVTEYEGLVPVARVVLFESLERNRKRTSFELSLDFISEALRKSIDSYRTRLIKDRSGDGEFYSDGLLGELRRLSKNTEELKGPKFA